MEKKLAKSKMIRRKYKHYAAALAGAAIMVGTTLHGVPVARAAAVEKPSPSPLITTEQIKLIIKMLKNQLLKPILPSPIPQLLQANVIKIKMINLLNVIDGINQAKSMTVMTINGMNMSDGLIVSNHFPSA